MIKSQIFFVVSEVWNVNELLGWHAVSVCFSA